MLLSLKLSLFSLPPSVLWVGRRCCTGAVIFEAFFCSPEIMVAQTSRSVHACAFSKVSSRGGINSVQMIGGRSDILLPLQRCFLPKSGRHSFAFRVLQPVDDAYWLGVAYSDVWVSISH